MPIFTRQPLPRTNTIIVGHDDLVKATLGIYPEPQGIAYVLQTDGEKSLKVIANVVPSD